VTALNGFPFTIPASAFVLVAAPASALGLVFAGAEEGALVEACATGALVPALGAGGGATGAGDPPPLHADVIAMHDDRHTPAAAALFFALIASETNSSPRG
jgi:hypothetical protein